MMNLWIRIAAVNKAVAINVLCVARITASGAEQIPTLFSVFVVASVRALNRRLLRHEQVMYAPIVKFAPDAERRQLLREPCAVFFAAWRQIKWIVRRRQRNEVADTAAH